MTHAFLEAWSNWKPVDAPFILPGDEEFVAPKSRCFRSSREYIDWEHFNDPDDSDFHLALYPQPMLGNLAAAKVVFLLLNPGLKPGDYFAEFENEEFRRAIHRSIKQDLRGMEYPFLFLDPLFSWHSGFAWWTKKLRPLVEAARTRHSLLPKDALRWVAERVASIKLYPYHSRKFKMSSRFREALPSRKLAEAFVRDVLVPQAKSGTILLVVMRQAKAWAIEKEAHGVLTFSAAEARGAHLSQGTEIGKQVLAHLGLAKS